MDKHSFHQKFPLDAEIAKILGKPNSSTPVGSALAFFATTTSEVELEEDLLPQIVCTISSYSTSLPSLVLRIASSCDVDDLVVDEDRADTEDFVELDVFVIEDFIDDTELSSFTFGLVATLASAIDARLDIF